jgi:hypothetical protein
MYKRRQPLRDTVTRWVRISGIPNTNIQNIVNEQASFQMWDKLDNKLFLDLGNIIYIGVGENINQFIHEA